MPAVDSEQSAPYCCPVGLRMCPVDHFNSEFVRNSIRPLCCYLQLCILMSAVYPASRLRQQNVLCIFGLTVADSVKYTVSATTVRSLVSSLSIADFVCRFGRNVCGTDDVDEARRRRRTNFTLSLVSIRKMLAWIVLCWEYVSNNISTAKNCIFER